MLSVVIYAMMGRAIMPLFVDVEDNRIYLFLTAITEPFILPVRYLLAKFNIGQNTPIDMSFMFTYIILIMLDAFLPII